MFYTIFNTNFLNMNEDLIIKNIAELKTDMVEVKEKLAEHEGKLDRLLNGQDKMMVILDRLDTERIFMNQKITELDEDVSKIKLQLKLA